MTATQTRMAGRQVARPPGPRGTDAASALARMVTGRPLDACTDLFARYGDTVYLPVRPWEGLYIFSRPEQAEHVLATNQGNYVKPFTYRPLRMLLGDGLLTAEGTAWRRHRRIIQPVFSSRNVASFATEMDAGARRALQRWNGSDVIEAASQMSALALDVVGRVLFGADLVAQAPSLGRTLAAGQWLALLGAFLPITWGPTSTRVVQAAARRLRAGAVQQQVEGLISRSREQQDGSPRDLLGLLAAARDADGSGLSQREIRDEVSTFLVAGHETTAMALTWSLALLSAYPQARQRLEDEVDAVLGDGPADPDKLPWTTAVISEAMRLYPPAWTLERTAVADDDVCGTPVPAGSMVAILPYLIHRNPAVWPNPAGFDPGRFLPGTPDRHRYAWIPFGGGKRGCIGAGFARLEAVLVLARLCRHYRLDLTGPALPRARGFVTLRPAGPVRMRLTRRGWLAHHAQNGSGNTVRPEDLYAGTPPWDIGRPQPAFLNLAREGAIQGRVLDAGCGTGEHSLMAASLGLDATGIDLSASALRAAEHKAGQRGLTARFLQWDALRLAELGESFDTVLDCGLFHILDGPDRAAYIRSLRAALIPGGRLFMLCLSDAQPPGDWGRAHRVSMGEIITAFADKWQVGSIEPATLDITGSPARIRAWLAAITRT